MSWYEPGDLVAFGGSEGFDVLALLAEGDFLLGGLRWGADSDVGGCSHGAIILGTPVQEGRSNGKLSCTIR